MIEVDRMISPDFETLSREGIVDFFQDHPKYGYAFGLDSGVWQNYTIREHTIMMMRQFDRYFAQSFDSPILSKGEFSIMLALHDIGKGVAVVDLGDKKKGRQVQHVYTAEIIPEMIKDLDMGDRAKMVITAVPINDVMGSLLRKHVDPAKQAKAVEEGKIIDSEEAAKRVKGMADEIGVSPSALFELYYEYFLSDASSYTLDANPNMGESPAGHEGLDHLFVVDRKEGEEVGSIRLISELEEKVAKTRELLRAS